MKYVRTKDKIIDVSCWSKDKNGYYTYESLDFGAPKIYIYKKDIIAEADTIEELCDEFIEETPIYKGNEAAGKDHSFWKYDKENNSFYNDFDENIMHKDFIDKEFNFYSAIYTDKGLIYVAKLNNKGEMELL